MCGEAHLLLQPPQPCPLSRPLGQGVRISLVTLSADDAPSPVHPLLEQFPESQPGALMDCLGATGAMAPAVPPVGTVLGSSGTLASPVLLTEAQGDH